MVTWLLSECSGEVFVAVVYGPWLVLVCLLAVAMERTIARRHEP